MKITIIIAPHTGGASVNVRTDGEPQGVAEELYFAALKTGITLALEVASEELKAAGVVKDFEIKAGEEARLRGEHRHGIPGESGNN